MLTSVKILRKEIQGAAALLLKLAVLSFWAAAGGCEEVERPQADPSDCDSFSEMELTYSDTVLPIIDEKGCKNCHRIGGAAASANYPLGDSYEQLLAKGTDSTDNLIPGDPQGSLFYQVLTLEAPAAPGRMPLGCSGDDCLSSSQIEQIYCWIETGAQKGADTTPPAADSSAPSFSQSSYSFDLAESASDGDAVGAVSATDPDGGSVTYSITSGNRGTAFAIDGSSGSLTVADASALTAAGTSYTLTITATDDDQETATTTAVIRITGPPSFSQSSYSFDLNAEASNGDAVGAVSAADPDGGSVAYSITAGDTGTAFAIDGGSGNLTVADASALTAAGTSYTLTIAATDDDQETAMVEATVAITDTLTFAQNSYSFDLDESAANGDTAGAVSASGPGGAAAYSITAGNIQTAFAIDSNGAITVADSTALLAAGQSYALTVTATNSSGTAMATVMIRITSLPSFAQSSYSFDLAESASNGDIVGTVSAADDDGGSVTYSITAGNRGTAFAIDGNSGAIAVANSAHLTAGESYSLTITATDDEQETTTATAAINVSGPPSFAQSSYSFNVNKPEASDGDSVGAVSAADPDGGSVTYSITAGDPDADFAINGNNGNLTVADAAGLITVGRFYTLTITATDDEGETATATATIAIWRGTDYEDNDCIAPPNWNDDIFPIVSGSYGCTGCHGTQGSYSLQTKADALGTGSDTVANVDDFRDPVESLLYRKVTNQLRSGEGNLMPLGSCSGDPGASGCITVAEANLLACWIWNGAR